jgi:L-histidine Nalpha-methyltransferase
VQATATSSIRHRAGSSPGCGSRSSDSGMVALARKIQAKPQRDERSAFAADVLQGLTASPKRLPAKYFYDDAGSLLFERITELPEYYPTRCEMGILRAHAVEICRLIPEGAALVEFGAGAAKKARILLRAAPQLAAYVPVDICGEMIEREAAELRPDFPKLKVLPVIADITTPFALPAEAKSAAARVGFFPGSTIGNFEPHEAAGFLRNAARILGKGATLIIGVDLIKAADVLKAAYNDAEGVTAKFNLNLLKRINRELGGSFKLECFEHHAFYNVERHRIEMHLASHKRQKVKVNGETIDFRAGETIHTENSYKYSVESLSALARGVGWLPAAAWTDDKKYFSIQAFTCAGDNGAA